MQFYNHISSQIIYWTKKTIRAIDAFWVQEESYGHIYRFNNNILKLNIKECYNANLFLIKDSHEYYLPYIPYAVDKTQLELFNITWEMVEYDDPFELRATIGSCISLINYNNFGEINGGIIPYICEVEKIPLGKNDYNFLLQEINYSDYSDFIISSAMCTKMLETKEIGKDYILLGCKY